MRPKLEGVPSHGATTAIGKTWRLTASAVKRLLKDSRFLLLGSVILYLFLSLTHFSYELDDSYISMRYAYNLANGNGIVYNSDPNYLNGEGYSNFLLVIIKSVFVRLGLASDLTYIKLFLTGIGVLCLFFIYSLYESQVKSKWNVVPVLALGSSLPFVIWTVGAMETVLLTFLLVFGVFRYWVEEFQSERQGFRTYDMIFLLAFMTRYEAILVYVAVVLHHFIYKILIPRSLRAFKQRLGGVLLFGGLMASYLGFKYLYYGDVVPLPFYAKTPWSTPGTVAFNLAGGLRRIVELLSINLNFAWLILLGGLLLAQIARAVMKHVPIGELARSAYLRKDISLHLIVSLVYLFYLAQLGYSKAQDDFFRYYVPVLPFLYGLFYLVVSASVRDLINFSRAPLRSLLIFVLIALTLYNYWELDNAYNNGRMGILGVRTKPAAWESKQLERGYIALEKWLESEYGDKYRGEYITLANAGTTAYYAKSFNVIDPWLNAPYLVRGGYRSIFEMLSIKLQGKTVSGLNPSQYVDYMFSYKPAFIIDCISYPIIMEDQRFATNYAQVVSPAFTYGIVEQNSDPICVYKRKDIE